MNLAARQGWLAAELENLVDDEDRLILDVVLLQEMSRIYIYIYMYNNLFRYNTWPLSA